MTATSTAATRRLEGYARWRGVTIGILRYSDSGDYAIASRDGVPLAHPKRLGDTAAKAEAAIDAELDLTATVTSVGPYGVTATRHWGPADAIALRNIQIHESDSPGITRHEVGDRIRLRATTTGPYETFARLREDC